MPKPSPQFWPFPVLPPEKRTNHHWKEFRFLEAAYLAGFQPCQFLDGEYQVHNEQDRYGWIICRGGFRNGAPTRWEVWLDEPSSRCAACWVNDFEAAAEAVLRWLAGHTASDILAATKNNVIKGPYLAGQQQSAILPQTSGELVVQQPLTFNE